MRKDEIVLPDGSQTFYHVIEKSQAVWILPITADNQIPLLYIYRYTVDDWCWELPAGGIKPEQTPQQAAEMELLEEVGGVAERWEEIGRFYTANGICNEVGHYYLATGVKLGETAHEPTEVMEVHLKPIAEVLHMARTGKISDSTSVMLLLLCQEKLLGMG